MVRKLRKVDVKQGFRVHQGSPRHGSLQFGVLLLFLTTLSVPLTGTTQVMDGNEIIDDRSTGTLHASRGGEWRLVTDEVMGGRSTGELQLDRYKARDCLRLHGSVTTANNGGFVQMALELAGGKRFDASEYAGVVLQVAGNGERYNLHLRTSDLWLPWQSYRASFVAEPGWREVRIPFTGLEAYRTGKDFRSSRLVRVGLVAIGREFEADLCVGTLRFYRGDKE